MRRTLLASVLPAIAITATWLSLERAPHVRDGVVVAALALLPALVPPGSRRLVACLGATVAAAWFTFGAQPWELLPFRDERVLGPALQDAANGVVDFYAVFLPFEATRSPEMHSLVLCAIFGFVLATALLVAARRPLAAAAVPVAAIGWPATLLGGRAVAIGALALAAALAIPLLLRAASGRAVLVGGLVAALVVVGAAGTSSATTLGTDAALDWETWDIRGGEQSQASSVHVIWDSNYEGITFPARKTVVLRIDGPTSANYWRATTLDQFVDDRWLENLFWLEQVDHGDRLLQLPQLVPQRAQRPDRWLEQRVEVEALVDDHLVAAGTPIALDARRLGTVFLLSGGVLRADRPVAEGRSYRIWSYSPDPAPRALAQAPIRFPPATARFREVDGRLFPAFGTDGRESVVRDLFADPSYAGFTRHRRMYDIARRVAGQADTAYGAVLALESWFRQTGGFTYDESPPRVGGPPLLAFVTRTRAGYCQHFAGAMAGMLRMLGIPARVAVGFTSGSPDDGEWVVTDHDAHAWVEVWFAGIGWVAFDPTPGRGTLGGEYTFASGSEAAVAALRRGELRRTTPERTPRLPDAGDLPGDVGSSDSSAAPSLVGVGLVLAAAWILLLGLGKAAMRRARYLSRDPRQLATASRRELEDFLRDQGADVPQTTATLATLQRAVNDELGLDARQFATAAARARFGPPDMGATEASRARGEARRIIRAARSELSVWARARGLVSLRSLRTAAGP